MTRPAEKFLTNVLFWYMVAVILVITLSPFRFSLPGPKTKLILYGGVEDVILNIFLFLPVGALFQIRRDQNCPADTSGQVKGLAALGFGLCFSLGIELSQLFLIKRSTALTDVLTNGLGAWLGALAVFRMKLRLSQWQRMRMARLLAGQPVFLLPYLVLPLLWLNGLGAVEQPGRIWFTLFVSVACARLTVGLEGSFPTGARFPALFLGWLFCGMAGHLLVQPLLSLAILGISTAAMVIFRFLDDSKQSAELPDALLRTIFISFLAYLVVLHFYPFGNLSLHWDFRFGISGFPENPPNEVIFQLLEYLGVVSLFGYLLSWLLDARESSDLVQKIGVAGWILGVTGLLELLRGFHGEFETSLLRFLFGAIAGFAGELIYRLQIGAIRRIRLQQPGETRPHYVR